MGKRQRRGEPAAHEAALRTLGIPILGAIRPPGWLEGGDVVWLDGRTLAVGRGYRTNDEGIAQLRALLEPRGAWVVAVPVERVLHLKSAVTALPSGSIVGWLPNVDDPSRFPRFVEVPEEAGAHVVLLGENRLLMAADCPRSAELFAGLGYEPVVVDIGEFEKLEGCVTCLSVRVPD